MATPIGPAASVPSTAANTGSAPAALQQEPLSKDPGEALKKKKRKQRRKKKRLIRRKRNADSGRFEPAPTVKFHEVKSNPAEAPAAPAAAAPAEAPAAQAAPASAPAKASDTSDVEAMRKNVLEGKAFVDEKGRVPPSILVALLYGGVRKYVVLLTLLLLVITGLVFLGIVYAWPPLFSRDKLTGLTFSDSLPKYDEDAARSLKITGYVVALVAGTLLALFGVGFFLLRKKYNLDADPISRDVSKQISELSDAERQAKVLKAVQSLNSDTNSNNNANAQPSGS